jgi:hypothetical protein
MIQPRDLPLGERLGHMLERTPLFLFECASQTGFRPPRTAIIAEKTRLGTAYLQPSRALPDAFMA